MTLTKSDLVKRILEDTRLDKPAAQALADQFFEAVKAALETGEPVKLSGLGHFDLRDKRPRPGRNSKTGEEFSITARRVVTFKAGPTLKAKVSGQAV